MEPIINSALNDSIQDIRQEPSPSNRECLEFWESEQTRPVFNAQTSGPPNYFLTTGQDFLKDAMQHPSLPEAVIKEQQLQRIKELVELAYKDIPVYRKKYQAAGFSPDDLRSFADIEKIPIITKSELIAAFPDECLNPNYEREYLYPTRSSGSSGQTLLIRVDEEAILKDTMQGIRQFALQSNFRYKASDLLAHVYTVPWWYNSVLGSFKTAFISNVIPPSRVAEHLKTIAPEILSCYPSNLEALIPYKDVFKDSLYLAVTHSEYSSRKARDEWSLRLGCPVLDEYSSEEGTRIALELPCGHYHICEDTVHMEALDPLTMKPQKAGESGIAVITNLLNTAMPFIRYVQGDCITLPQTKASCSINWSQVGSIDGRINDAFINIHGRRVPAGSLLDVTYRWMFDMDLHLSQFELVQKEKQVIEATFVPGALGVETRLQAAIGHLETLLSMCMEHPVQVKARSVASFPESSAKRRPIRSEVQN